MEIFLNAGPNIFLKFHRSLLIRKKKSKHIKKTTIPVDVKSFPFCKQFLLTIFLLLIRHCVIYLPQNTLNLIEHKKTKYFLVIPMTTIINYENRLKTFIFTIIFHVIFFTHDYVININ